MAELCPLTLLLCGDVRSTSLLKSACPRRIWPHPCLIVSSSLQVSQHHLAMTRDLRQAASCSHVPTLPHMPKLRMCRGHWAIFACQRNHSGHGGDPTEGAHQASHVQATVPMHLVLTCEHERVHLLLSCHSPVPQVQPRSLLSFQSPLLDRLLEARACTGSEAGPLSCS